MKTFFLDDQILINLNPTDRLDNVSTDSGLDKDKKKKKVTRKRCAPSSSSSSESDSSDSDLSTDCRRKYANRIPQQYEIELLLQLRNENPRVTPTIPLFPTRLTVEFERGFHIEQGFYDQAKMVAQVQILSSDEFTKLSDTHKITLTAPQFKYQVDKSGLMDEVPYPTNEFFRRNCKDPFTESRKGEKPKTHMELSFHCALTPILKEAPRCSHEDEAMAK